jgi:hypothetical protein
LWLRSRFLADLAHGRDRKATLLLGRGPERKPLDRRRSGCWMGRTKWLHDRRTAPLPCQPGQEGTIFAHRVSGANFDSPPATPIAGDRLVRSVHALPSPCGDDDRWRIREAI